MHSDNFKKIGIYIHVPFCKSKCLYCDFCSFPQISRDKIDLYAERLVNDILSFKAPDGVKYFPADTIYFGGGTPTVLDPCHFEKILLAIKKRFGISDDAEITTECNPKTADYEKLLALRGLGINRLSIGVQSSDKDELKDLGRIHSFEDCKNTVNEARRAGFENISLDLMYGIPNQTRESFNRSLLDVMSLNPNHISSYALKIEEGTPFYRLKDTLILPCEDEVCLMYEDMCNSLSENGYNKYEISNFSKSGYESRHNLKYWTYEDYIGFGVSAHSFVGGERIENSRDFDCYINGTNIEISREKISFDEQKNEYVMLAMRLSGGVDICDFNKRFGLDFYSEFGAGFEEFAPEFVEMSDTYCRFTEKGFFVSNYILSEVLNF